MSEVPLPLVAYFSMEYGLHEEFPSYAGGLGVLAGDFMKSAGDLGLPVVGVGLRWAQGYTAQRIGPDGYPIDEWHDHQPTFLTDTGVRVRVRIGSREVACCVWRVGRYAIAPLFLLEPMDARDRWITRRLYDTRPDCRLAQEMLLGIGGVRALRALHLPVSLYHFNEGHAVFAGIELIADRMEAGATFEKAWQAARERIVFTTHTPVPAGNEVHPLADLRRLGASCELVDSEMREIGGDPFNMTVAGLRLARSANAVAQLHGETARAMWAHVDGAAPIIAVTNGVHVGTWQDPRIPPALASDDSLLRVRRSLKQELLAEVAARTGVRLDPDALTIGFARRAATYKRPDLILRDPDRLAPLLKERRVQLIFSGKAHPADHAGKAVIALLIETIRQWPDSIVYLDNYDMALGRLLTRGCRRVAQYAAAAAGGQRHLGHEGGHERHAEPLRARRVVAGGLRARRDGLGHRGRQRGPGPGSPRSPRALRDPRGRGPPRLRRPVALDADDARLHPHGRRALLVRPHGHRVLLPPLRRRLTPRGPGGAMMPG